MDIFPYHSNFVPLNENLCYFRTKLIQEFVTIVTMWCFCVFPEADSKIIQWHDLNILSSVIVIYYLLILEFYMAVKKYIT